MKKKNKVRINWDKLFDYISGFIIIVGILSYCICYSVNSDKQIQKYIDNQIVNKY